MRPQLFTAENWATGLADIASWIGFNEAAALHCGKPNYFLDYPKLPLLLQ